MLSAAQCSDAVDQTVALASSGSVRHARRRSCCRVPIDLILAVATLGTLLLGPIQAWSESAAESQAGKIISFGDVHGGASELRSLLQALELIDSAGDWIGGRTRLVSLGDLLDRGPDSREVMDLLMRLETQAAEAGGRVHVVLGNHEVMNLTGDLRYVAAEEFAAFAADEDPADRSEALTEYRLAIAPADQADDASESPSDNPALDAVAEAEFAKRYPPGYFGHRAAFAADGYYGRWLLSKPQVLVLDRTAFVHGGLSSRFADLSIDAFNEDAGQQIRSLLKLGADLIGDGRLQPRHDLLSARALDTTRPLPQDFIELKQAFAFSDTGPSWYRGTATCHPLIEAPRFARVLAANSLDRVIMGHTPTSPRIVQSRFDDRAILADTGMLESYYRGRPSAVVLDGGRLFALTLNEAGTLMPRLGRPAIDRRIAEGEQFQSAFTKALSAINLTAELTISPANTFNLEVLGRTYQARFIRERKAQTNARLAAEALDSLLNLGLVAPVFAHNHGKQSGVLELIPARSMNEVERVNGNHYRPNGCEGTSDYQLMYALDALLGIDVRTGQTLHYDPSNWLLYLTDHAAAFPPGTRLPSYLEKMSPVLPVALAEKLATLDQDGLEVVLGAYLTERQIKALLDRRDIMIETWPAEE